MLTRLSLAALMVIAATLAYAARPIDADDAPTQRARIHLSQPTLVAGKILVGDYIVVHDETREARGEPCTVFYRAAEQVTEEVAFHCIRSHRPAAEKLTLVTRATTRRITTNGVNAVELLEFQFAGDTDAHGVPLR